MTFFTVIQLAAAVLALRADAPSLDLNIARTMTPAALADALLPPGHPPVVEAVVHPAGMEAPAPFVTKVELLSAPQMTADSGFCSAALYTVSFESPASAKWNALATYPVRPLSLAVETVYRLPNSARPLGTDGCAAPMHSHFHVDPSMHGREFQLMRLLAQSQKAAKSGAALPFDLSVQDKMADDFERLNRSRPDGWQPAVFGANEFARLRDGRQALSAIPFEDTAYIAFDPTSIDPVIIPSHPPGDCTQRVCTAELLVGVEWRAEVAFTATKIVSLHVTRAIPAPF